LYTFDIICAVVKEIPHGKVATYGQIAAIVSPGLPARIVGFALHGLSHDSLQQKLLEQEGILFTTNGKVDLKKYLWSPDLVNK
jgi:methylated-DNA-protein-cysteine methyltransferase-like protein